MPESKEGAFKKIVRGATIGGLLAGGVADALAPPVASANSPAEQPTATTTPQATETAEAYFAKVRQVEDKGGSPKDWQEVLKEAPSRELRDKAAGEWIKSEQGTATAKEIATMTQEALPSATATATKTPEATPTVVPAAPPEGGELTRAFLDGVVVGLGIAGGLAIVFGERLARLGRWLRDHARQGPRMVLAVTGNLIIAIGGGIVRVGRWLRERGQRGQGEEEPRTGGQENDNQLPPGD